MQIDAEDNSRNEIQAKKSFQQCNGVKAWMDVNIVLPRLAFVRNIEFGSSDKRGFDAEQPFDYGNTVVQ